MFGIPEVIFLLLCLLVVYFRSGLGHLIHHISNHINTSTTIFDPPPNMMARGGSARIPSRRIQPFPNRPNQSPEQTTTHYPTPKDCAMVKGILAKAANFPPELADIVMDFAEYWACSVASIDYSVTANQNHAIHGGRSDENQMLLRTEPLGLTTWHSNDEELWHAEAPACKIEEEYPRKELERFVEGPPSTLEHPFRKIIFDIVSRDQGWSHEPDTHHTYRSSWTWFDAGIDRFDKAHNCSAGCNCTENLKSESSSSREKVPTTCAIRPVWPPLKKKDSSEKEKKNSSDYEYDHQLHSTSDHKIRCNRVAEHDWQHHHIEWSWADAIDPDSNAGKELEANGRGSATGNGNFLRSLKVGDMVTVWGRARFPGWANRIQKVEVQVYWAQ
ncbi:hypothetical protein HD806DRAFT_485720 [Xylariaceae sp. AK1471]|nr:hypothetical protein HD806DRAFT_485720 [Xylariaceae sp. AK1471]